MCRIQHVRRFSGLQQPRIHSFQHVCFVVGGLDDVESRTRVVAVRRNLLNDAVQRIEAAGTGEGFIGCRVLVPVNGGLVGGTG